MNQFEYMSIPSKFEFNDFEDDRFKKIRIYVMHDNLNLNNSFFSMDSIESAKDSINNIPILAFVKQIDGTDEKDFGGHEIELVVSDGEYKFRYLGKPIGVIPAENNNYHYETIDDKTYVVVDGYIWVDYANEALEILERDKEKPHSMEIKIIQYSYNNKFKYVEIDKYLYTGLTLLGNNVTPAMDGSKAKLFSKYDFNEDYFKKIEELNNVLKQSSTLFSSSQNDVQINNNQKGGNTVDEKLKLLEQFSVTQEQILQFDANINFEEITLEQLEEKIKEYQQQVQFNDNTNFSLMNTQLQHELSIELSKEKFKNRWGDDCCRYWYVDHTDTIVIAMDNADNYRLFAFNYFIKGDNVVIDFDSKKRQKITYVDFEDGTEEPVVVFICKDLVDYQQSMIKEELKKQFSTEKKSLIAEYESAITEINEKFSALEQEKLQLQEYQQKKIKEERDVAENKLFEHFANILSEEEIASIKEISSQFSLSELEEKLYVLVGKKTAKFSANKKENKIIKVDFDVNSDFNYSTSWEHLVEQHVSNKKY